jgi:hypothetical protein
MREQNVGAGRGKETGEEEGKEEKGERGNGKEKWER